MPVKDLEEMDASKDEARRAFLKNCATYAAAMPPAISLLVSAQGAFGQVNPQCSKLCPAPDPPIPPACLCDEQSSTGFVAPQFEEELDPGTN
jgi:hypothetical protein